MNVQFSLSATGSASGQSKSEAVSGSGPVSTGSSQASTTSPVASVIKTAKELSVRERQGGGVSIAEEQLIKTIERAVKSLQGPQTTLEISVHEKTHDIMVKVLNKDTGELIREVPPEKTLDLVAKMMEIAGILIDEKI